MSAMWSTNIAKKIDSPGEFLKLIELGTVGTIALKTGGRKTTKPRAQTQTIQNQVYDLGLDIDVEDVRRDQGLGMWPAKVAEIGGKFASHIDKLTVALITANPTCFDGAALFSASHTILGAGVQGNLGTSNLQSNLVGKAQVPGLQVVAPATPTALEMAKAIMGVVSWFYTMVDDAGDPINGVAKKFLITTSNPNLYASAIAAIGSLQLDQGVTNPLFAGYEAKGFKFDVAFDPRLGAPGNVVFDTWRTDSIITPVIWSEEHGVEMMVLGEGSDHYVKENAYYWGAKAVRNVGPGRYQHCVRSTLTT
jgi:phage major head subunit gpT-like protein